ALDPFAPGNEPVATPKPTEPPTASPAPPTDAPSATPAPSAGASASVAPSAAPPTPTEGAKAQPSSAPQTPDATDEPALAPAGWTELNFDADDAPIIDWQVRWSLDGQVLGIWIADAPGTIWGRLTVLGVDPDTDKVAVDDPLLSPA